MKQNKSLRVWAAFIIGFAAIIGVGALLVYLGRGPQAPVAIPAPASSNADENPIVASVNGQPIRHSSWQKAALLDQVLSDLAKQPLPETNDTVQRLVNEELVLQAFPPEQTATSEQVEGRITRLEAAWGLSDDAVVAALENAGLVRADLAGAIERLIAVQAGLEAIEGQDTASWLAEQRESADIVIDPAFENAAVPYTPIAQAQAQPQSPLVAPDASPLPTSPPEPTLEPTPAPPPSPTSAADVALPEVAPDFSLERAGGGTLTLSEQLAKGPVVLVFFQKCG